MNSFKKYFVGMVMVAIVVLAPFYSANAQMAGDDDTQTSLTTCLTLTKDLRQGTRDTATDASVSQLQDFLLSRGYFNQEPTGYFGRLTFLAVQKLQSKNNLRATGFVGPLTRGVIGKISCNNVNEVVTEPKDPMTIPVIKPYVVRPEYEYKPVLKESTTGNYSRSMGTFAAVRFTVPSSSFAGAYKIKAAVKPILVGPRSADADFHVVKGSTEVYNKYLEANQTDAYETSLDLQTGETVDFLVGRGKDGKLYASGLDLKLTITSPSGTVYDLSNEFPTKVNPAGAWTLGYKGSETGTFYPFVNSYVVPDENGHSVDSWSVTSTEPPSIYHNGNSFTVTANSQASIFPPGAVWLSAGLEISTYGDVGTTKPYIEPPKIPYPTATTTPIQTIVVSSPKSGDLWYEGEAYTISWSPVIGDFDAYQVLLGNKMVPGMMAGGPVFNQVSKNLTSTTFDPRDLSATLVKSWVLNSGGISEQLIRDKFFFIVRAIKNSSTGKDGAPIGQGVSGVFSIRSKNVTGNQTPINISPQITADGFVYKTVVGQSFSKNFIADASASWSIGKGEFPQGLSLTTTGAFSSQISGVPTTAGNYLFTIQAYDTTYTKATNQAVIQIIVSPASTETPPNVATTTVTKLPVAPLSFVYISQAKQTVNSGQTVSLKFAIPSNTISSKFYLNCPTGVAVTAFSGTSTTSICNTWQTWTTAVNEYSFTVNNNSGVVQKLIPSFYVTTADNPNSSKGANGEITVQPVITSGANVYDAFRL